MDSLIGDCEPSQSPPNIEGGGIKDEKRLAGTSIDSSSFRWLFEKRAPFHALGSSFFFSGSSRLSWSLLLLNKIIFSKKIKSMPGIDSFKK